MSALLFAAGAMITAYFLDFTMLAKIPLLLYASAVGVIMVGIPFSSRVNGVLTSVSFFNISTISLSQLAIIFPLAYALLIYSMRNWGYGGILLCGVGALIPAVFLLYLPTFFGAICFLVSALVLLCAAIYKNWFQVDKVKALLFVLVPTLLAMGSAFLLLYRKERIFVMLHPELDPYGRGYVGSVINGLISQVGFLQNNAEQIKVFDFLSPDLVASEYIVAFITYNFGWIAFFFLAILFTIFIAFGFLQAVRQKSILGFLVSLSIMLVFTIQVLFYFITNLGYIIFSPFPLPFVAYGNTSLFLNGVLVGFMLSVFRTGDVFWDNRETKPPQRRPRWKIVRVE